MKKRFLTVLGAAMLATVGLGATNASATTTTAAPAPVHHDGDLGYGPDIYGCRDAPHTPITVGYQGASVRLLQCMLNQYNLGYPGGGPNLAVDGIFGPRTKEAVLRFKRIFFGSASDPIVGPNTWHELLWTCECGGA